MSSHSHKQINRSALQASLTGEPCWLVQRYCLVLEAFWEHDLGKELLHLPHLNRVRLTWTWPLPTANPPSLSFMLLGKTASSCHCSLCLEQCHTSAGPQVWPPHDLQVWHLSRAAPCLCSSRSCLWVCTVLPLGASMNMLILTFATRSNQVSRVV